MPKSKTKKSKIELNKARTAAASAANHKHGESHKQGESASTLRYAIWEAIKRRTSDPNDKGYSRYGAIGITLYPAWQNNFKKFRNYIMRLPNCPPKKLLVSRGGGKRLKMSIDRIDSKQSYVPGNLKWSTPKEQARNRISTNWQIHPKTKKKISLAELCEDYNVGYQKVWQRLKRGWELTDALTK